MTFESLCKAIGELAAFLMKRATDFEGGVCVMGRQSPGKGAPPLGNVAQRPSFVAPQHRQPVVEISPHRDDGEIAGLTGSAVEKTPQAAIALRSGTR